MKHLLTGSPPMITTSQRTGREPSLMLKVRVVKSDNCSTSRPYPVYIPINILANAPFYDIGHTFKLLSPVLHSILTLSS